MIHDKADQAEFMVLVQRECSHRKRGDVILLYMAQKAYDLDIVEEEALNAWWVDERSNKGKEIVKVREKVAQFIKWLAEAESEEEESEDEDEESD